LFMGTIHQSSTIHYISFYILTPVLLIQTTCPSFSTHADLYRMTGDATGH
jgi:hypothetical protein